MTRANNLSWHWAWLLVCVGTRLVLCSSEGCEGTDKCTNCTFMLSTFLVPSADIQSFPEKYIDFPLTDKDLLREVPRPVVSFAKYSLTTNEQVDTKKDIAEINVLQRVGRPQVVLYPPRQNGAGGRLHVTLRFYIEAKYELNNTVPEVSYNCPENRTVHKKFDCHPHSESHQCHPHDCGEVYHWGPYDCSPRDCDPFKCREHSCQPCWFFGVSGCTGTCYDTCYHTCYSTCYHNSRHKTCWDKCSKTVYDQCRKTVTETHNHRCVHAAAGCAGATSHQPVMTVGLDLNLTTGHVQTYHKVNSVNPGGKCWRFVKYDVESVGNAIGEIIGKTWSLRDTLRWWSHTSEAENTTIYYRFCNLTIARPGSSLYGSIEACMKSEAGGEFFPPHEDRRGMANTCRERVQYSETVRPVSGPDGTALEEEVVLDASGSTLSFNVTGTGSTYLRLYDQHSDGASEPASFWEVLFALSPEECAVSLRVVTGSLLLEERNSTCSANCVECQWHLSVSAEQKSMALQGGDWEVELVGTTSTTTTMTSTSSTTVTITTTTTTTVTTAVAPAWHLRLSTTDPEDVKFTLYGKHREEVRYHVPANGSVNVHTGGGLLQSTGNRTSLHFRFEENLGASQASIDILSRSRPYTIDFTQRRPNRTNPSPSPSRSGSLSWFHWPLPLPHVGETAGPVPGRQCFATVEGRSKRMSPCSGFCEVSLACPEGQRGQLMVSCNGSASAPVQPADWTVECGTPPASFAVKTAMRRGTWHFEELRTPFKSRPRRSLLFPRAQSVLYTDAEGNATVSLGFQWPHHRVAVELGGASRCGFSFTLDGSADRATIKPLCQHKGAGAATTRAQHFVRSSTTWLWLQVDPLDRWAAIGTGDAGQGVLLRWDEEHTGAPRLGTLSPGVAGNSGTARADGGNVAGTKARRWPGAPAKVRLYRSRDADVTWQVLERRKVCGGAMPVPWNGTSANHSVVRISSTFFEGLVWARMMKHVAVLSNRVDKLMDAQITYVANASRPQLDMSGACSVFRFSLAEAGFRSVCKGRPNPLIVAQLHNISGEGQITARRGSNRSLHFSVALSDKRLEEFTMTSATLEEPELPTPPEVLNHQLQGLLKMVIPSINAALKKMPCKVPARYARFIPCSEESSVRNVCPVSVRRVSFAPFANFAYLEMSHEPRQSQRVSYEAQNSPDMRTRRRGDAGGFPQALTWLCARCAGTCASCGRAKGRTQVGRGSLKVGRPWWYNRLLWMVLLLASFGVVCKVWAPWAFTDAVFPVPSLLISHGLVWVLANPFRDFSSANLQKLGIEPEVFDVESTVKQFESWTCLGAAVTLLEGILGTVVLIAAKHPSWNCLAVLKLKEAWPWARVYVCILAVFTQVALLVGLPMCIRIGEILACTVTDSDDPEVCSLEANSTAELWLRVLTPGAGHKIVSYASTLVNSMFTGLFVTYVGIYFTFLLLAATVGTFVGAVLFSLHVDCVGSGTMEMAVCFTVLTDFVIGAALLGPFVVVHQTLGGNLTWWALLLAPLLCRPIVTILVRALGKPLSLHVKAVACWGGAGTVGSCVAAGVLWVQVTGALGDVGVLSVSGLFTCWMCLTTAVCVATASFIAFENHACSRFAPEPLMQDGATYFLEQLDVADIASRINSVADRLSHRPQIAPWLWWLLSMDALATLYYHLVKTIWLGWKTNCFHNWWLMPQALWILSQFSDKQFVAFLHEEYLKMNAEEDVQLPWSISAPVFLFCCCLALLTSHLFYRMHARVLGTARAEPEVEEFQHEVVRRLEFLLVGLGHWSLVFARKKILRQGTPHNFDVMSLAIETEAGNNRTTKQFHLLLKKTYGLTLPQGDSTMLDQAYLKLDTCLGWTLFIEGLALCVGCQAAAFHIKGLMARSRGCVVCAGVLRVTAALLPLLPNYIAVLDLARYHEGCGDRFDAYVRRALNVLGGTAFSAALGRVVLGNSFLLPISLVRGLWLLLLRPEGSAEEVLGSPGDSSAEDRPLRLLSEGDPASFSSSPPVSPVEDGTRLGVLCHLMLFVACLIPIMTLFPLLFVAQLTEDKETRWLVAFWLGPQVWIVQRFGAAGRDSPYRQLRFYPIWLCIYLALSAIFLQRQFNILQFNLVEHLRKIDWPYAWSWMHADFCIVNVLVTDVLEVLLESLPRFLPL